MAHIKNLRDIRASHVQSAGGKGASLGELLAAGISVPPGFVITTEAFEHVTATLPVVTAETILATPIPPSLQKEIVAEYTALDCEFVAVRSSATAEDGASHAWAGQLESFVPTSKSEVIDNIKKCWASLFSQRATAYREQAGLAHANVSVAVVVQALVDSEHAGIGFSSHPVSGNTDQVVIESVHGLGEAAVGGHVTPHTYVVSKFGGDIIEIYEGTQDRMLVRGGDHKAQWRPIPADATQLTQKDLAELTATIARIERHFGKPMDVEWARAHNTFYIVQSRPITTT
jgi:phosphoenolpyruvate synthase/pyruvate phosphate dikinase